mmetsp:Transcript_22051/g.59481  ORF Transcript_22051/g.59481 Transcript_22051/m.59481 type:complete len:104 (+) Transcript_22051:787-1098(+)
MTTRSQARLLGRAREARGWEALRLVVQYLRERGRIALLNFHFMHMQYLYVIDYSLVPRGDLQERLRLDGLIVSLGNGYTQWLDEFMELQGRHEGAVEALATTP